jgi:DnaJ like chaperone protein
MSLWSRIAAALSALAGGEALSAVFEKLRAPPERSVAFTIAVIALGAKMAKADGHVTRSEVAAFREVFLLPPEEEGNAARVFNLARQDVAGFEDYARRIRGMFPGDGPEDRQILVDLLEGLCHIAAADHHFHPREEAFLQRVAEIFGLDGPTFCCVMARNIPDAPPDPYAVLGVARDAPLDEVRAAWRTAVKEAHPDRMIARGLPPEAVKLAERRLQALNRAWEDIARDRAA